MFVARIHNSSLGRCLEVDSWDDGVATIIEWATDQGFELSEENKEEIANDGEYFNDDDDDNVYCFAIGLFDGEKLSFVNN